MRPRRLFGIAIAFLMAAVVGIAQQADNPAPPPSANPLARLVPLNLVAAPYDPSEPVTGGARQVTTAEERAALLELLTKAHDMSNVRRHPYEMKTRFTTFGSATDGQWLLEDAAPGPGIYRWSAQGPSFSGVFLTEKGLISSNYEDVAFPLRLSQVRHAMWGVFSPGIGSYASMRVTTADLAGAEVRCVLVGRFLQAGKQPEYVPGRSMIESEYCVDARTGLLASFSPAPGLYFRYDYTNAIHFHDDVTLPGAFTISEAGRTVIEGKIESVGDPPQPTNPIFERSGLKPLGVGVVLDTPTVETRLLVSQSVDADAIGQAVLVDGIFSADQKLIEGTVLARTQGGLDQLALDYLSKPIPAWTLPAAPGTTRHARQEIVAVQFVPVPKNSCLTAGGGTTCPNRSLPQ